MYSSMDGLTSVPDYCAWCTRSLMWRKSRKASLWTIPLSPAQKGFRLTEGCVHHNRREIRRRSEFLEYAEYQCTQLPSGAFLNVPVHGDILLKLLDQFFSALSQFFDAQNINSALVLRKRITIRQFFLA